MVHCYAPSLYCSGYIHFVIFLPVCLLLVSIKYLLLLYSLTSSALLSHSHLAPTSSFRTFPLTGEKGLLEILLFWWFLCPSKPFFLSGSSFTLYYPFPPPLHSPFSLSLSPSYAFIPYPAPPPLCMLKYSVKEGSRGGGGGERGRGGIGGGGRMDVRSAAVVMIFCSLFLGTAGPLRATVSSTVFTESLSEEEYYTLQSCTWLVSSLYRSRAWWFICHLFKYGKYHKAESDAFYYGLHVCIYRQNIGCANCIEAKYSSTAFQGIYSPVRISVFHYYAYSACLFVLQIALNVSFGGY